MPLKAEEIIGRIEGALGWAAIPQRPLGVRLQDIEAEIARLRRREITAKALEFVKRFDAWAKSPELCGGPLFDAMLTGRDEMRGNTNETP